MSDINVLQQKVQINLLQAEGQLNRDIHIALQDFRRKLTQKISSSIPKDNINKYQTFKQGPQKTFQFRQSLLSIMFKIKDFKTLYNMVIASFIILTFTLIFSNYYQHGQLIEHAELGLMFEGQSKVLTYWLGLTVTHFTVILVMKISLRCPKIIWIPIYLIHIFSLIGIAIYASSYQKLGFASIIIIMTQATRMVMKSHSYFRTKMLYLTDNKYKNFTIKGYSAQNQKLSGYQKSSRKSDLQQKSQKIQKVSKQKQKKTQIQRQKKVSIQRQKKVSIQIYNNEIFTQVKYLSYFFLAPTVIYRDRYTLTPIRQMSKIIINGLNFIACIYYSFILYVFICKPAIEDLQNKLDFTTFMMTVIKLMLPSTFFLILGFFGFLHSWLNCWAEITRFPDRCFYSDWWNSIQFGSYYRKWNIIVHDWLYYFIYLDICRFTSCSDKPSNLAKLMTFFISAVLHQLIITYALGFFYPILFILFTGPGIILIQNQKNLKSISVNLAFWLEMYIGTSLLFTFYLIQSFARKRITDQFIYNQWGNIGYFIPRTIYLGNHA